MTQSEQPRKDALRQPLSPAKVLAIGFLLIILAGALLLMLPISLKEGKHLSFVEALYTATSATCVTGLAVVDTYSTFSIFGQLVTLSLIQVGGLGFMLFATMALVAMGRRISLRNRMLLRETMSLPGLSGGVRSTIRFMVIAFSVELAGALLLAIRFVPQMGVGKGLYFGVYHSISAFCNAGFDLFSTAGSLQPFRADPLVLLTISGLIILGGLGFMVIADCRDHLHKPRQLSLHSKIVLSTSLILILSGTLLFALMEWNNSQTLAREGAGFFEKLLNAWFQSVTTRTAGFYSFSQGAMSDASKLLTILLMFIGASPASTGGGVKTSSVFVIVMILSSIMAGREDINAYGKRLPASIGRTAQIILFIYLTLLIVGGIFVAMIEQHSGFSMLDMLFEEASALGTVGLSGLNSAAFKLPSKLLFITLMYFGRVGPLTMMLSFNRSGPAPGAHIRFPEEQIIVG